MGNSIERKSKARNRKEKNRVLLSEVIRKIKILKNSYKRLITPPSWSGQEIKNFKTHLNFVSINKSWVKIFFQSYII